MIAECKKCGARAAIPEDSELFIACNGECQFDCDFQLDYTTYPNGEEIQHWSTINT